jgi:hypothetical protein
VRTTVATFIISNSSCTCTTNVPQRRSRLMFLSPIPGLLFLFVINFQTYPACPVSRRTERFGSGVSVGLLPLDSRISTYKKPTIAIMSFGEMGMGIATLLLKYSYSVITNLDGRRKNTKARAQSVGVKDFPLKKTLEEATIMLSIVPPAEAYSLAKLTATAMQAVTKQTRKLVYMDLNAVSPDLSREIAEVVNTAGMTFIDGVLSSYKISAI